MSKWHTAQLFTLLVLCISGAQALAAEDARLSHNPFLRPPILSEERLISEAAHENWSAELRATLVAGPHSIANVGGHLIALGEELGGYRLIAVNETQATFLKNSQRITLVVGSSRTRKGND